jgi:beta-lactam-binding protein with PASTA domain
VLLGVLGAGAWGVSSFLNVPTVDLPNVVGMPVGQAQSTLNDYKLANKVVSYVFDDKIPATSVVKQIPDAGTPVKMGGRTIELVISKGPEQQEVPNVIGSLEDEARIALTNTRFVIGKVTYKESAEPEGRVIDQVPGPKTIQKAGAQIDLVVSKGRLKVPLIKGLKLDEAQRQLLAAGLTVGKVETKYDTTAPKDTVISASPNPGEAIEQGAKVDLVVATDVPPPPAPGGPTPGQPVSFTKLVTVPSDAGKAGAPTQIILVDDYGGQVHEQTLLNEMLKAGDKVTVRGQFQGQAWLRVVVNNVERQYIPLP